MRAESTIINTLKDGRDIPNKKYIYFILGIIALLYIIISLPHIVDNNFFAPDADRIAMDGIFLLDFFKDLPESALHPYEYTTRYYAKYPALSIGYRPPFFPLIEALGYSLIGFSHVTAKLSVLLFLFMGMFFWFLLVRQTHGTDIAVISLLLWITNPFIYRYSQHTMLEIPTLSMSILCVYLLLIYFSQPSFQRATILGIAVGLTLWTNQKSGFVLPLILIYPLIAKKGRLLFARQSWLAYGLILLFVIPLGLITLWLGDQNIAQSIGTGGGVRRIFSGAGLIKNIYFLFHNHFSPLLLILILIGIFNSITKKNSNKLIYISVIIAVYLFFTYIRHKIPRYSMYWIPFFCLFASLGLMQVLTWLKKVIKSENRVISLIFCSVPVIFQLSMLPGVFVPYASGYEEAAKYVIKKTRSPVVFFEGYANGQFIFFFRFHDADREFFVLRGDKIISSSSIFYKNRLKIHLHNKQEILQSIHDMGVQFIVVESRNVSKLKIYDKFRDLLRDESRFKLHKVIDVDSNVFHLRDQKLLIYEYLKWEGIKDGKVLKLRLPVVGQTITIETDRLFKKK